MTDRILQLISHTEEPPASIERSVLIGTDLADQYSAVSGPLGMVHVGFTSIGVSSIVPTANEEDFLIAHGKRVGRPAYRGELPSELGTQLAKTFDSGKLGKLPVDLRPLTPFQREVLEVTATIPPGEVRPYGWVASEMGNEGAVRAVGSALGRNPVPIAIPCHRVVKSDGDVGNYAFGPAMKHELLEHEGMTEFGRLRYVGSDTTSIYCYPTCRAARRITTKHRVEFANPVRANEAGYRACKLCRPI